MSAETEDEPAIEVSFPPEAERALKNLLATPGHDFARLALAAGLDPRTDFRGADLRGIDFSSTNLEGFNFTGANLTGAVLPRDPGQGPILNEDVPQSPSTDTVASSPARSETEAIIHTGTGKLEAKSRVTAIATRVETLWAAWTDTKSATSRSLMLQLGEPLPISATTVLVKVPSEGPAIVTIRTGEVGAPRRILRPSPPPHASYALMLPARSSVEIEAADGHFQRIPHVSDVTVTIGHFEGDEQLAGDLSQALRKRGVVVVARVDIGTVQGSRRAEEAAAVRPESFIILIGPEGLRYAKKPGLHAGPPRTIIVTHGVLLDDQLDLAAAGEVFDMTLPATGLAKLLHRLDTPTWDNGGWWDRGGSYPEKSLPLVDPAPALLHGVPRQGAFRPALREVIQALTEAADPLQIIHKDAEYRLSMAASIARVAAIRRQFPDGIFYVAPDREEADVAVLLLRALALPVPKQWRSETARDILREGRCLVLIDTASASTKDAMVLTGAEGRTVFLSSSPGHLEMPGKTLSIIEGAGFGLERVVFLLHAPGDERVAARAAAKLQKAGIGVWLFPIDKVTMPIMDPEVTLLTPRLVEYLADLGELPESRVAPPGFARFALHKGWDGPLPEHLINAVAIDMEDRDWAYQFALRFPLG